jgi:glutaredoxin
MHQKPTATLYVFKTCAFSNSAINLCKSKGLKTKVVDMNECGGKRVVIQTLKDNGFIRASSTHNTAPIVFLDKKFIGGYTELKKTCDKTMS